MLWYDSAYQTQTKNGNLITYIVGSPSKTRNYFLGMDKTIQKADQPSVKKQSRR